MSESKVFMFPEGGFGGNNSIDPNLMMALNQNGGFGGNNWIWILFLWFLFPGFRNGEFGGANNAHGQDLLMAAIQGNGDAIRQLSSTLNCDVESIKNGINGIINSVQGVGNQVGMSSMQVINAVQAGNTSLGQLIAQCCCENRLAISQLTNALENTIERSARMTQSASDHGFHTVLAKLDAIQTLSLQDKIDALREDKATLATQINLEHLNAYNANLVALTVTPIANQITNLATEVASIKCQLPSTTTIPYSPVTAVPNCVAYNMGYCNNGGFWY